ncbi:MAG TPA: V-type proton ATPase subunit E [Methanobacteriaceae archaeon]|nr:V-type proton ATPase subunit E [Methanobacteriaceae archaeon]
MSSGAEKIVSSILEEAEGEAQSILAEAEEKASKIKTDGEQKAEMEKDRILEGAQKQSQMKYQQIISEAKMNSRRMELEAREEVIEAAFQKAEEKLKDLASSSSSEYLEALKKIIKEASVEIGGGELILHVKEDDAAKIKDSLTALASEVSQDTGNTTTMEMGSAISTIGGAVIKTKNGEIEVNNTIEARILRFKKMLRSEVARVLFQ